MVICFNVLRATLTKTPERWVCCKSALTVKPTPRNPATCRGVHCLEPALLVDIAEGQLSSEPLSAVDAHLDECADCRTLLAAYIKHRTPEGSAPSHDSLIRKGTAVGRYLILDVIARGGIGVVYTAYDPQLDRKVALKLLRSVSASTSPGEANSRVLHEARALARLSHRHVVTVFDVGVADGRDFIAMELVVGRSLRRWLEEAPRSWRQIRDVFIQAGRGLEAAHAMEIIHCDFKPENVLVGFDGVVRVTDFGLAAMAEPVTRPPAATLDQSCMTGGTPSYMSPEQRAREPLDHRTDQYSFCVALFEAWFGERPSPGKALSSSRQVPAALSQVLDRGLARSREARFASMGEVLKRLQYDPSRRRRQLLWAVSAVIAFALSTALGAWHLAERSSQLCRDVEVPLRGLWDEPRRAVAERAFLATGKPYASDAFRAVDEGMKGFETHWADMRRESCRATRVHGVQSDQALGLRAACLDRRLLEARHFAELLEQADPAMVERATSSVQSVENLSPCADLIALSAPEQLPMTMQSELLEIQGQLAKASALLLAQRRDEALEKTRQVEQRAQQLAYAPLQAEALVLRSKIESGLGDQSASIDTAHQAAILAEVGGDVALEAAAYLRLAQAFVDHDQASIGVLFAPHAAACLKRLGPHPELEGRLELLLAQAAIVSHYQVRTAAVALQHVRRARELLQHAAEPQSGVLAMALSDEGTILSDLGQHKEAIETHRRALAATLALFGPHHPSTANKSYNFGEALLAASQIAEALAQQREALRIRSASYGLQHPLTVWTRYTIGYYLTKTDQQQEALHVLQSVLPQVQQTYGPTHHKVALVQQALGAAFSGVRRFDESLFAYQQALRINETSGGPVFDQAFFLERIGETYLILNQPTKAVEPLERAVQLLASISEYPLTKSTTRFTLARALWNSGGDRHRAHALALEARDSVTPDTADARSLLTECQSWIAAHPVPRRTSP